MGHARRLARDGGVAYVGATRKKEEEGVFGGDQRHKGGQRGRVGEREREIDRERRRESSIPRCN